MIKNTRMVICLCLALAISGTAGAESEYVLSYSYAELKSDSGRKLVLNRIVHAAKRYCPDYATVRSIDAVQTCVDGVIADLVAKVQDQGFTAYVQGQRSNDWSIARVQPESR